MSFRLILLFIIAVLLMSTITPKADASVLLNSYTFSDDSAEIWKNQYFSNFYTTADQPSLYYGSWSYMAYGDFHEYIAEFFDKIDTYKNIKCVVYREHGYWPEWIPESGSPGDNEYIPGYYKGIRYTRYNYLAKDTEGNIHILQSLRPNETDVDDAGVVLEGGTTLLFPEQPMVEQPVYQGYVASIDISNTNNAIHQYSNCIAIIRIIKYSLDDTDELRGTVQYVHPGDGIVEISYNWQDLEDFSHDATGVSGFSLDTSLNTYASLDDHQDSVKPWYHCFIETTACDDPSSIYFMMALFIFFLFRTSLRFKLKYYSRKKF